MKEQQLIISYGTQEDYSFLVDVILDMQESGELEKISARIVDVKSEPQTQHVHTGEEKIYQPSTLENGIED
jgi:hypothetical protein